MPGNWFASPRDVLDNHGPEAVTDQLRRSYAAGHKLDVEVSQVSEEVRHRLSIAELQNSSVLVSHTFGRRAGSGAGGEDAV